MPVHPDDAALLAKGHPAFDNRRHLEAAGHYGIAVEQHWRTVAPSGIGAALAVFLVGEQPVTLTILLCPVACVKGGVTQVNFTAIPVAHLPVSNQRCFRIATIWESICLNPLRRSGVPLHSERY